MWRFALVVAIATALLAPASSAWSRAQTMEFEALLVDTQVVGWPDQGAGSDWFAGGIAHARGVLVTDTITGDLVGSAERSISFDMNPATGTSAARCTFTFQLTAPVIGTWTGRCQGSLTEGTFEGRGVDGTLIQGTYGLTPEGVPAVGPYQLEGRILQPSGQSHA